ncbi:MAG: hypothetical protein K1X35_01020 [Caulobacteraceae bacterium]|nr:hypothetical protein [Caulobacteraceae bacterium]
MRIAVPLRIATRAFFWLACAVGLGLALTPNLGPELPPGPYDKIEHFIGFYALAVSGLLAYPDHPRRWLFAGLLTFGGAIEILQMIPALHRDAEWGDLAADAIGVGMALLPTFIRRA